MFALKMITTLSTCAQLDRENIKFRLNGGHKPYIERSGKLSKRVGSIKTAEKKWGDYKDIICYLKRSYFVSNVAKFTNIGVNTVQ